MGFSIDVYTSYDSLGEIMELRKEEIIDNCMGYEPYWEMLRGMMLENPNLAVELLDILREASQKPFRDPAEYRRYMIRMLEVFEDHTANTAENYYEELDDEVVSNLKDD
jgi:hypothetical protein